MAAAMLAACGSQPPIGAPGAMPQSHAIATHAERGGSWMLPEAKSSDLLYASSGRTMVYVFTYPQGKLVGTLSGFEGAQGECVDNSGNVFITNYGTSQIFEYAHGATSPVDTLADGTYGPVGCSVDPMSGNLAVANFNNSSVSVYESASGSPSVLSTPGLAVQFCAYDGAGDLFADGYGQQFAFGEFPAGSGTFENITFYGSKYVTPGPIQWDGSHVALGYGLDNNSLIYQLSFSGSKATVVGTTELKGPGNFDISSGAQWWIRGNKIIALYARRGLKSNNIGFWNYPRGGNLVKKITYKGAEDKQLWGVTISPAPH